MKPEEVKSLLEQALPDCEIQVAGGDRNFDLVLVGDVFEGVRPVKRQQLVYGALNEQIAAGDIHAINMRTFTPEEWQSRSGA
jgi:acid stress-induced BolA-like protein IbaG/YrbA